MLVSENCRQWPGEESDIANRQRITNRTPASRAVGEDSVHLGGVGEEVVDLGEAGVVAELVPGGRGLGVVARADVRPEDVLFGRGEGDPRRVQERFVPLEVGRARFRVPGWLARRSGAGRPGPSPRGLTAGSLAWLPPPADGAARGRHRPRRLARFVHAWRRRSRFPRAGPGRKGTRPFFWPWPTRRPRCRCRRTRRTGVPSSAATVMLASPQARSRNRNGRPTASVSCRCSTSRTSRCAR